MDWCCAFKWQEEGYILTEIPHGRILAGTEFWTCDLLIQIFLDLQPCLPYRIWPFSWLHVVGPHSSSKFSGGPLCSSHQQAVRNTIQTFPDLVHLERVCRPSAWLTCSCSGAQLWFSSAAPGIPTRSPIQVLSMNNFAELQCSNRNWCFQHGLVLSLL